MQNLYAIIPSMTRIFFFIIAFAVLILLSFCSVKIFTTLLKVSEPWLKYINIFGFVFPFIIALAMAISRFSDGILARIFYTKIMLLTGIMFYVFIMACILGIILIIDKFAHLDINWFYLAKFALIIAFSLSAIGLIQSFFLKTVTYTIKNSPESLHGKKFVLLADTHLGLINQTKLSKRAVEKVLNINPDAVLIAGDFFDGPDFSLEKSMNVWKKLSEKIPVFYAPGNHEEYGPYEKFINSLKDSKFTALEDESTYFENIQIMGLKYRTKGQEKETEEVLSKIHDRKSPSILINHPPLFQEVASNHGVFLEVSGHTHRGQFWPFGYIVKPIYKYFYGQHIIGNLTQITTSGVGTASVPFRTFNTPEIVIINFE